MSLKKEASGRRSVQVEVEVPGTPEQVWQAIATGPGVSSWFVPTEMEEVGGKTVAVTSHFGPGMDSKATVTAWEPPHRFAAESSGLGPNAPPMATEWTVEAKSGSTCVVRVVHSLFASTDDWDDQLTNVEHGWPAFFRILRLYLTHFRSQPCAGMQQMAMAAGTEGDAWATISKALNLANVQVGQHWTAPPGAPSFGGIVERIEHGTPKHELLLRLDQPVPGITSLCAYACGGPIFVFGCHYWYGDQAAAAVAKNEPLWQAWLKEKFPPAEKK